jgi:hypothetical protein
MAIVIPSKNIYTKNNPKIRDNVLDKVTVNQTVISPIEEKDRLVYSETFKRSTSGLTVETLGEDLDQDFGTLLVSDISANPQLYNFALSYIETTRTYYNKTIKIPVATDNYYISSLLLGKNEEIGVPNIKVTLRGMIEEGKSTGDVTVNSLDDVVVSVHYNESITSTKKDKIIDYAPMLPITNPVQNGIATANTSIDFSVGNVSEITEAPIITENGIDYYSITLRILANLQIYKLSLSDSYRFYIYGSNSNVATFPQTPVNYERYLTTFVEVSFYGNTIGISLEDGTYTYSSGNNPYSLEGNELIQDSAEVNEQSLSRHIASKIYSQYRLGKETATLRCSISDYYDENGELKILYDSYNNNYAVKVSFETGLASTTITVSTYDDKKYPFNLDILLKFTTKLGLKGSKQITFPSQSTTFTTTLSGVRISTMDEITVLPPPQFDMSFKLHDKVIPMICDINGNDKPMSQYQNGNPKVFDIVGVNMIYDGAVWQELTLQEQLQQN